MKFHPADPEDQIFVSVVSILTKVNFRMEKINVLYQIYNLYNIIYMICSLLDVSKQFWQIFIIVYEFIVLNRKYVCPSGPEAKIELCRKTLKMPTDQQS